MVKKLLSFLKKLMDNKFTGRIVLNFHKGNLSKKVGRKESVDLDSIGLLCAKIKAEEIKKEIDIV